LNDTQPLTLDFRFTLDYANQTQLIRRKLNLLQEFPLSLFFSATSLPVSKWSSLYNTNISFMSNDLPDNVHLLSLVKKKKNKKLKKRKNGKKVIKTSK
jgi:hypothetical protein